MNERIRELATQVGISVEYLTNTKQIVLIDAFAQLIVEECARLVDQDWHVSGAELKEHFGVEE